MIVKATTDRTLSIESRDTFVAERFHVCRVPVVREPQLETGNAEVADRPVLFGDLGRGESTEISFSKPSYRNEFQITIMVGRDNGLAVMALPTTNARSRATVRSHSLGRTLLVAAVLALVPVTVLVAIEVAGLTLAFLAGAGTGVALALRRRRAESRATVDDAASAPALGGAE